MTVQAFAASDVGKKRKHNEDSFLVDPELGLYVVADGMGGHAAGDVASRRCVEIVREQLLANRKVLEAFGADPSLETREATQRVVARAIQAACKGIWDIAERDPTKRGMGTTCVLLVVCGRQGIVAHVGDSRAYLLRGGRVHQLTEDHSLVEEHVKRGLLTREQAEKSDIRNVITRAVGIQESVEVDTLFTEVAPGDMFLLCSDGVHGYLKDKELVPLFSYEPRAQLPKKLVDLANDRGGKDNSTVLVVSAGPAATAQEAAQPSDVDQKAEILRRIPLFQFMTYKELLSLLAIVKARQFQAGQYIVKERESGDEMFVIFRGHVRIEKGGAPIATLKAGGHFGEMGLIDQAPRSASVVAVEPTQAISLGREALLRLMRKESLVAVKLLWSFTQVLSERLRKTNDALSGLQDEVAKLRAAETVTDLEVVALPPPPLPFGDD
jgi:serine/threonine protein phosphatase PrpC/CRP-like cAMP-binding protein